MDVQAGDMQAASPKKRHGRSQRCCLGAVGPAAPSSQAAASAPAALDLGAFSQLKKLMASPKLCLRHSPDGQVSLIDLAVLFLGRKPSVTSGTVRRSLASHPDLRAKCSVCKISGPGNDAVAVAPALVAIEFMFLLPPGNHPVELLTRASKLVARYLGCDASQVDAILQQEHVQSAVEKMQAAVQKRQRVASAAAAVGESAEAPALDVADQSGASPGAASSPAGESSGEAAAVLAQIRQLAGRPELRLRVTVDRRVALIDVAMLFTGLNNDAAGRAVRELQAAYPEFRCDPTKVGKHKFEGVGRQTVDVAPIAVAIEFAFLLPGRRAAQLRMQAARLLVRYLGGDLSLVDEIAQLRHVQQALADVPSESLTPEQQAVRTCGVAVEAATPQPVLAGPPQTEYLPAAPSCLDGQPADLYVLSCEHGLRPGRTSLATKDARLLSHRRAYGQGAFFLLYAPNYGHVETALHRYLRPLSIEPARARNEVVAANGVTKDDLKEAIQRLDAMAREEAALRNTAEASRSRKRTREEAQEELDIAEIDARRDAKRAQAAQATAQAAQATAQAASYELFLQLVRDNDSSARAAFVEMMKRPGWLVPAAAAP
jgi:hypothetical protein